MITATNFRAAAIAALLLLATLGIQAALGADFPIRPDAALTPGAVRTSDAREICAAGFTTKSVRHTSAATKESVYKAYGITKAQRAAQDEEPDKASDGSLATSHFEIDHLISLELGGADEAKNLWPQSYDTEPWNAHVKDKLENKLHAMVCAGQLGLPEAQRAIATDWIATYQTYIARAPPPPSAR